MANVYQTVTGGTILYEGTCWFIESFVDELGSHTLYTEIYDNCADCFIDGNLCVTPTVTPTPTTTTTPTVTQTQTNTITPTTTTTPTVTSTPTNTNTLTNTPTNTQTPTNTYTPNGSPLPTLTPSVTESSEVCSDYLCVNFEVDSFTGYNGNYIDAGSYNGKIYYTGVTAPGVVYYNGERWCLSTTLASGCIFGSNPTNSLCPSFIDSITQGECIVNTNTPTLHKQILRHLQTL